MFNKLQITAKANNYLYREVLYNNYLSFYMKPVLFIQRSTFIEIYELQISLIISLIFSESIYA